MLRFFMQNDSPYYNDHDFPNPEYMIVCSGYQQLVGIEGVSSSGSIIVEYLDHEKNDQVHVVREPERLGNEHDNVCNIPTEEDIITDKLGRKHYRRFMAGPTLLVLGATLFQTSSSEKHASNILSMLLARVNDGKGVTFIKVDNRSDWNLHLMVHDYYFFKLWKRVM